MESLLFFFPPHQVIIWRSILDFLLLRLFFCRRRAVSQRFLKCCVVARRKAIDWWYKIWARQIWFPSVVFCMSLCLSSSSSSTTVVVALTCSDALINLGVAFGSSCRWFQAFHHSSKGLTEPRGVIFLWDLLQVKSSCSWRRKRGSFCQEGRREAS